MPSSNSRKRISTLVAQDNETAHAIIHIAMGSKASWTAAEIAVLLEELDSCQMRLDEWAFQRQRKTQ